jgi:hypothetical protein
MPEETGKIKRARKLAVLPLRAALRSADARSPRPSQIALMQREAGPLAGLVLTGAYNHRVWMVRQPQTGMAPFGVEPILHLGHGQEVRKIMPL